MRTEAEYGIHRAWCPQRGSAYRVSAYRRSTAAQAAHGAEGSREIPREAYDAGERPFAGRPHELEPDGHCVMLRDSGHQACECGRNPLRGAGDGHPHRRRATRCTTSSTRR